MERASLTLNFDDVPRSQPTAIAAEAAKPRSWFRGDVDGLRAIAILLVVGYHAGLAGFDGGFIGVDIFFVISGFLISRNLLRESHETNRVALLDFWGRRLRRLVPALALVVLVTLVAGAFILPGYRQADLAQQGAAAALYVSNMLFAVQASSYFAADVASSPFLHTWSLGVEEQFYLLWPLLFAAVYASSLARWTRRRPGSRRRILVAVFGVTLAVSLTWSLWLTRAGSDWAFFGLPSRAWEFAVAGLVAAITVPDVLRSVVVRTAMAVAGIATLVVALVLIDDTLPYPGFWALLPVGATVLLITAGETFGGEAAPSPVSSALAVRPAQWLGRVSYSWYLWHWPAIVLGVAAFRDVDPNTVQIVAALASLPVAWLAYRYFETPVRFAKPIARSNARTYAFGGIVTAAVLVAAFVIAPDTAPVAPGPSSSVAALQAPPGSSLDERIDFAVNEYVQRRDYYCPTDRLKTASGDLYCELGDPAGPSVLMIGDSHTGQWWETVGEAASQEGIRLFVHQHSGCPPYPVPIATPKKPDDLEQCREAAASDQRVIEDLQPDAVLIASWSGNLANIHADDGSVPDRAEQVRLWERGVRTMLEGLKAKGIAAGIILDEPTLPGDPKDCLAAKGEIAPCEVDRDDATATAGPLLDVERRVVADLDLVSLDMTDIVCDEERCRLEIDGTLVYVDAQHLTAAFAASQLPRVTTLLQQLVAKIG